MNHVKGAAPERTAPVQVDETRTAPSDIALGLVCDSDCISDRAFCRPEWIWLAVLTFELRMDALRAVIPR